MSGHRFNRNRWRAIDGKSTLLTLILALQALSTAAAEESHRGHMGASMPSMQMPVAKTDTSSRVESTDKTAMAANRDMTSGTMAMESMQGGEPGSDSRDPHAFADGFDFGPYKLALADTQNFGSLLVDNLEAARSDGNSSTAYDLQAWYGRSYDRLVLKAEGDIDGNQLEDARTELLWGHALRPYWDGQIGLRYDSGEGPNRTWLGFGVQGLAPYWFEVDATAYLGENGRTALRLDASYDLLLTQKLIFQPRLEADIYGKKDAARGLGKGLSAITAQLRLRYEIRREFAPYVGVEYARRFGKTRDFAAATGAHTNDVRFVAGLRFWF